MSGKNFDELLPQERTFEVRGETFTYRDVRPEVIAAFSQEANGDEKSVWERQDEQILAFLDDKDHERWKTLRARDEDPITIAQSNAILTWLFEGATGNRPTEPPSPSQPGRGRTAASSKGA